MSVNARHEINFSFVVSGNHEEGSLVNVSAADLGLSLCKTSLGDRMLPMSPSKQDHYYLSPNSPNKDCLGHGVSLNRLGCRGSSPHLQLPFLNISFLTCWMKVIVSVSTPLFEDGETLMMSSLWNGFERYQVSYLDGKGLCSRWLTCTNSSPLPDSALGLVLWLSWFCRCKNWSAGKRGDFSIMSEMTRQIGTQKPGSWGPVFVLLTAPYLGE